MDVEIRYSKAEIESMVKERIRKLQDKWHRGRKDRTYYTIQKKVGVLVGCSGNRRTDELISGMRFGHTGLN